MFFNTELLSWFGNFINFLIFVYLAINIVNTSCFNIFQMSLSLIGILASIIMSMISIIINQNLRQKKCY